MISQIAALWAKTKKRVQKPQNFRYSRPVMGNPNRLEGQIFVKMSCKGPKYSLKLHI